MGANPNKAWSPGWMDEPFQFLDQHMLKEVGCERQKVTEIG